jgi:membrane-associated protein
MNILLSLINIFTNLDKSLAWAVGSYGILVYFLLFFIIFLETGIVFAPFLPGDSLLFTAGALSSQKLLNIFLLFFILSLAAILGNTTNYFIGKYIGKEISEFHMIKKKYLVKTNKFYAKYGGKTIIISRFIPIVRTFAPFIAGIGKMEFSKFSFYNIVGSLLWVFLFLIIGFFFGNIPLVKNNFSIAILIIIFISLIPAIVEYLRHRLKK